VQPTITVQELRRYCLRKPGDIVEDFPFDEETLVIKVFGKMFLLTSLTETPPAVNLKCDPDRALELRAEYDAVKPGYHMNKRHWNTVVLDGSIPVGEILRMVDHSYDQVVAGLPLRIRTKLGAPPHQKKGRTSRPRLRKRA
jgi:predicted DNA-binding protein (MmcQ/YjbR family)